MHGHLWYNNREIVPFWVYELKDIIRWAVIFMYFIQDIDFNTISQFVIKMRDGKCIPFTLFHTFLPLDCNNTVKVVIPNDKQIEEITVELPNEEDMMPFFEENVGILQLAVSSMKKCTPDIFVGKTKF